MKTYNFFLFTLVGLLMAGSTYSQKLFSEGIIKYEVYLNGSIKPDGIYIVTVKNGFTKRELAMNSGYNNVAYFNHKTGVSTTLNIDNENKYALVMSDAEVKEKNKRFEHAVFTSLNKSKKIAGYTCNASKVTYTNGDTVTIYFTTELNSQSDEINSMFPDLKGIPLEYDLKSSATVTMKFFATSIDIKSVDSQVFLIPKDYKIVTKSDLEKLK